MFQAGQKDRTLERAKSRMKGLPRVAEVNQWHCDLLKSFLDLGNVDGPP
jgi:hypothetical protein